MTIHPSDRVQRRQARLLHICRSYKKRQRELLMRQLLLDERNENLAIALKEARFQLGRIHSEINSELETAQRIQEGLLPKALPATINLKSAAKYIPAGKVGGDLYDIIITPRQKIALLIYDVSGHGIPAALIGAMAKMLFAHTIEKSDSPAQVFDTVNRQLCNCIKTEQYLTAFLGIIDPVSNIMTYARAGHVPPFIYHSHDQSITRLDTKGFFIGHSALLPIAEYSDETIRLMCGDKILFYSDGLTEGTNSRGHLYGNERLKTVFKQSGSQDVNVIIDAIVDDQQQFREGTPLRDDFTLLCIQIGDSEQLMASSGFSREDAPSILVARKLSDIDGVCSIILREMDQHGFSDKNIKQFKICVFEMITNAILHGNLRDDHKKVLIFYKITRYEAVISVVDEGPGFNFRVLPDPLLPENRTLDHGRGLFLILHYFDSVEFNETGNRILGRRKQER